LSRGSVEPDHRRGVVVAADTAVGSCADQIYCPDTAQSLLRAQCLCADPILGAVVWWTLCCRPMLWADAPWLSASRSVAATKGFAILRNDTGSKPGNIGAGSATRQGRPVAAHAVGARGGEGQRENKPAHSSYTTIHAACRSITDSVSLVLTLPVSPVLLATRVLVVSVRGPVVPVFPVLPLVAHLAGLPQSVKPVRSKNRRVPCGLCRNS
jgi:hypothetical protein